jgi:geranylgeranyl pyrophosphate synthase
MPAHGSLDEYLADLRQLTEAALEHALDARGAPMVVAEPIRYSLLGAGKRLRPCLTLAAADTVASVVGLDGDQARQMAVPGAVAVEMIHAYSLVHDDLPAMDNDDMRRGRPTTHIVHGDGLAILAGDGLLTDAFAVLAADDALVASGRVERPEASRRLRAIRVLADAAGSAGMVGGQAIDLAAVGRVGRGNHALDADALRDMHARKTGALIRAACVLGAILPGAGDAEIQALDRYGAELGLAFQIVDDILDVEGSDKDLGKTAGKDAAAGKPTFPAIYGLERSREMAASCIGRAEQALDQAGLGGRLREVARWSLARKH